MAPDHANPGMFYRLFAELRLSTCASSRQGNLSSCQDGSEATYDLRCQATATVSNLTIYLCSCAQFVVAWRFHVGAFKALRRGAANMDVLVSLGTNASYFYSVMSVAHHHLMVRLLVRVGCNSGQTLGKGS